MTVVRDFLVFVWRWFWRKPRYKVGSMMFCGDTGSFKTFSAWREAVRYRSVIYQTIGPDCRPLDASQQRVVYFDDPAQLEGRKCGVVVIDEAGLLLDSQKWQSLPDSLRKGAYEQRKFHWRVLMTAQKPGSVDNHFRDICPEIILCRAMKIPLLGLIWPDCRVRDLKCPHHGEFCDGVCVRGDWFSGTIVIHYYIDWTSWDKYRAQLQGGVFGHFGKKSPRIELKPIRTRFVFYSQKVADSYSSMTTVNDSNFHRSRV